MFKYLIRGVLAGVAIKLLADGRRLSVQMLKIRAATCYVRGVQMARVSALGLLRLGLMVGLICVGALLVHVGLFLLLPWSTETKALVGIVLGLGYMASGWVVLRRGFSEKTWLEHAGVAKVLAAATDTPTQR